jgi:hypothetical protein
MYTVCYTNHALRSGGYRGTFETPEAAKDYATSEAARSRAFMEYEVWLGTPRVPRKPLGIIVKGTL